MAISGPFLPFLQCFGLGLGQIFVINNFCFIFKLQWCFWGYLEVVCKNVKKCKNPALQGQNMGILLPFLHFFFLKWIFPIFWYDVSGHIQNWFAKNGTKRNDSFSICRGGVGGAFVAGGGAIFISEPFMITDTDS